jgi:hypothetical protein
MLQRKPLRTRGALPGRLLNRRHLGAPRPLLRRPHPPSEERDELSSSDNRPRSTGSVRADFPRGGARVGEPAARRNRPRARTNFVRPRVTRVNRRQTVVAGANRTRGAVAANVAGVAGRAMLAAIVGGAVDAAALAGLAHGKRCRKGEESAQCPRPAMGDRQLARLEQAGTIPGAAGQATTEPGGGRETAGEARCTVGVS